MSKKTITAYKGFDKDLRCRGFQYEIGETVKTDKSPVRCTSQGFHACENPFDVWSYYGPCDDNGDINRFAVVQCSGEIDRGRGDTKFAAAEMTVSIELSLPDFIKRGVDYILSRASGKDENTGDRSAATNTGYQSVATNTGNWSAATNTGDWSAATNTGNWSAATNTGYQSAATNTGNWSAATNTGYQSAATNTGDRSAATNTGNWSAATNTGDRSAATNTGNRSAATNTGDRSAATNTGDRSAATNTGYQSVAKVEGDHSVAVACGYKSKASASIGSAIFLVERNDDGSIAHVWAGIAGHDNVKPDTFYTLKNGNPVEVE